MSELHLRFPCVPFIVMNAAESSFYKLQISYNGWLWCRGQRSDLEGELKFSHRNDIYRCAADTATVVLFLFQLPYYIDGSVTLTQSSTILRYLARKHGLGKYHKTYFSCTLHILVLPVMEGWWRRAPNAGGVVRIGDFRQITGYISKTVKDRHIVSIKVE